MNVVIRALTPDDWQALRDVRLRALREEPGVFFRSLAEEEPLTEADWRARIAGPDHQVFGLFDGPALVGITAVFPDRLDPATTAGLAMSYIAPEYRGRGFTGLLYEVRLAWLRSHPRYRRAVVSHRRSNLASMRAIQRHGFHETGVEPHRWPDGAEEDEVLYELVL